MNTVTHYEFRQELARINYELIKFTGNNGKYWSSLGAFVADIDSDHVITRIDVNWSACGSQNVQNVEQFALELLQAAKLAKDFKYIGCKIEG